MKQLLFTKIGQLRLVSYLEGCSLIILLLVAVPLKYLNKDPRLVQAIAPIHGILFLLFIIATLSVGIEKNWKFKTITWKVLLACLIPFGTFYIDCNILRHEDEKAS